MSAEIALGFGNSVDYEIDWNAEVFEDLIDCYGIRNDELNTSSAIHSERDLVVSILGFMNSADGGERYVSDIEVIGRFAAQFEKKITLGGTSVRAAVAMRKLGHTSALHLITQNDHVRRLIPPDCPYVCSNPRDSSYPHLIVQFDNDARVRAGDIDIRASRPNRLIYHSNTDNISMRLNEDFADLIAGAKVLLISGFNAMQSKPLLADRLTTLMRMIDRLPDDATIFYEDGGYFDRGCSKLVFGTLGRRLDVCSLNEDELQIHLNRKVALCDVGEIRKAVTDLHRLIPASTLVVHTQNWAVAHGAGASRYAAALRAGVTIATTRFRYGDDFTLENYREIDGCAPHAQNERFAEAINSTADGNMVCLPVAAVEQTNATTVGLGDAFVGGFLPSLLA